VSQQWSCSFFVRSFVLRTFIFSPKGEKTMKQTVRILLTTLLLFALLSAFAIPALAADNVVSGTWGNLSWALNRTTGELVISGEGRMKHFLSDSKEAWRAYYTKIKAVRIESGVTSIGYNALRDCSSLTSATIPNSVTDIYNGAFRDCSSLASITIPNSVTSIGYKTFSGCSSLMSITIPHGVTDISYEAFSGCSSLTSITFPDSVTSIGDYAFYGCNSLTSISVAAGNPIYHSEGNCLIKTESNTLILGCKNSKIPNSVTSIGLGAFSNCNSLTNITIPDSITSIREDAFSGCTGLTSITIPESVTYICGSAFSGCCSLTSITVAASNPIYHSEENCLIETESNTLILGCQSSIIPNAITSIGNWAFSNCHNLTSIKIPHGVTDIGYEAFSGCSSLTSITIPENVISLGPFAFSDCANLKNIHFCGSKKDWMAFQIAVPEGAIVTFGHTWGRGETINGTPLNVCTLCGKSETHTYAWSYMDTQNHKGVCDCGDTVTAPHSWNADRILNGVKLYTCTGCGITKMEAVEVSDTRTGSCKGSISTDLSVMLLAMAGLACALTLKKKKK
jgi:hypothetical protein